VFLSVVTLSKSSVDPDRISRSPNYAASFKVDIHFKDLCHTCKATDSIDSKCRHCAAKMH